MGACVARDVVVCAACCSHSTEESRNIVGGVVQLVPGSAADKDSCCSSMVADSIPVKERVCGDQRRSVSAVYPSACLQSVHLDSGCYAGAGFESVV